MSIQPYYKHIRHHGGMSNNDLYKICREEKHFRRKGMKVTQKDHEHKSISIWKCIQLQLLHEEAEKKQGNRML